MGDADDSRPLHYAAFGTSPEIVKLLIDHGASAEDTDRRGNTPYDILLRRDGSEDVAMHNAFLEAVPSMALWKDSDGWTVLMHAIYRKKSRRVLEAIIRNGGEVNVFDSAGNTPLHYSVSAYGFCSTTGVSCLIDNGAHTFLENQSGRTAYEILCAMTRDWLHVHEVVGGGYILAGEICYMT